jgi:hypothetical protein
MKKVFALNVVIWLENVAIRGLEKICDYLVSKN